VGCAGQASPRGRSGAAAARRPSFGTLTGGQRTLFDERVDHACCCAPARPAHHVIAIDLVDFS
jgi:hypothetical protein